MGAVFKKNKRIKRTTLNIAAYGSACMGSDACKKPD
jgi:hypothetical protein